jgi:hypothetical protein
MGWSEDAARNRDLWTKSNAEYTDAQAAEKWALDEVTWGLWDVPEARPVGVDITPAQLETTRRLMAETTSIWIEWGRRRPVEEIWAARKRA